MVIVCGMPRTFGIAAGLRACKRCRPDLFYRGEDENIALFEGLAARVRGDIAGFADAFGMKVVTGGGRAATAERAEKDGRPYIAEQSRFFEICDVISVHLRLLAATRGVITGADLARMKADALFVNTSRAELVEPGALVRALKSGRPGYAAVDVYEDEPVATDHPLLAMDNVLCTPHLGYVEKDTYELFFGVAIEQIEAFAAGRPINVLNPPSR